MSDEILRLLSMSSYEIAQKVERDTKQMWRGIKPTRKPADKKTSTKNSD